MTTILVKRGTTEKIAAYTGECGELVFDTDAKNLYVMDGETVGGIQVGSNDSSGDIDGGVLEEPSYPHLTITVTLNGDNTVRIIDNNPIDSNSNLYIDDTESYVLAKWEGKSGETHEFVIDYFDQGLGDVSCNVKVVPLSFGGLGGLDVGAGCNMSIIDNGITLGVKDITINATAGITFNAS